MTTLTASKEHCIQRLAREVFSHGIIGVIPELVTPDVVYESPTSVAHGVDQLTHLISTLRSVWADLAVTIPEIRGGPDIVEAEMEFSGRHVRDFMGIEATGKAFQVRGRVMFAFRGDLICRIDVAYFLNSWLDQVGQA
jgi:predicted ester cyclase